MESFFVNDEMRYGQVMKLMEKEQFERQMREAARLLQAGDGVAAIPILERLHSLFPDDVDVKHNLSGAYILAKRYRQAVEILEPLAALGNENPAVWSNLAAAYLGNLAISSREKQDLAIETYQRVLELDPYYPNTHYNLGLIYEDRGDWVKAREMFAKAMQADPNDRDARTLHAKAEHFLEEDANGTVN